MTRIRIAARGWIWRGAFLRLFAGQPDIAIDHFERYRRISPPDPLLPRCLSGICTAISSIDGSKKRRSSVTERIVRRAVREIGTALYRAYLQRLIPEVRTMRAEIDPSSAWTQRKCGAAT